MWSIWICSYSKWLTTCVFAFWVLRWDVRYNFRIKTMFGLSLPSVVRGWVNVLFVLFVFVCVWWCLAHIILCFWFVYLRLVNHMLPVSLDCPFWLPLWYSLTFIVCCLPIKCNINSAVFITNNDQFLVFLLKKIHPDSVWFKH